MINGLINQNSQLSYAYIDEEKIRALKKTIMPAEATNEDLELFIEYCRRTKLDPFARQIYALPSGRKDKRISIQTSIDGFRVIAQRTGEYRGQETFFCGDDGKWIADVWLESKPPAAAKVIVYRSGLDKGVVGVAKWSEYYKRSDKYTVWDKMPSVMLAKCAESLAFRKAFPNELSGLYTQEEMTQVDKNEAIDVKISKENKTIDYTIVPSGKNKGKKWEELDGEVLLESLKYYTSKNDDDAKTYIQVINDVLVERQNNNIQAEYSIPPFPVAEETNWENGAIQDLKNDEEYMFGDDEDPFSSASDSDWDKDIKNDGKIDENEDILF